jgi:hypothetical protein
VQIPLLGEPQGLLEHLLCIRLEHKLLTQAERGVVIHSLQGRRNVALPQGHIALRILGESLIGPLERTEIRLEHNSIDRGSYPEGDQELPASQFPQSFCLGDRNLGIKQSRRFNLAPQQREQALNRSTCMDRADMRFGKHLLKYPERREVTSRHLADANGYVTQVNEPLNFRPRLRKKGEAAH